MKQLKHIVCITESDTEIILHGEAAELKKKENITAHIPLHNIDEIISFSYIPASPSFMEECAKRNISFCVLNQYGKLRYRIIGETHGNPFLRKMQYEKFFDENYSLNTAKIIIAGKIKNSYTLIRKYKKNHPETADRLDIIYKAIKEQAEKTDACETKKKLRGTEGICARIYFDAIEIMTKPTDKSMEFGERSRRPPLDPCNAMLSLAYTLLANQCTAALEAVGLDPYIGVLHEIKSGKPALALDLAEEMRAVIADRFVIRLINLNMITGKHFEIGDEGVKLTTDGLKIFFKEWSKLREHKIKIEDENESIALGLLSYYQAWKLSRTIYEKDSLYKPYSVKEL